MKAYEIGLAGDDLAAWNWTAAYLGEPADIEAILKRAISENIVRSRTIQAQIELRSSAGVPKVIDVSGQEMITIGTSPDNDIQVVSPVVAAHHARILLRGETWHLLNTGQSAILLSETEHLPPSHSLEITSGFSFRIFPFSLKFTAEITKQTETCEVMDVRWTPNTWAEHRADPGGSDASAIWVRALELCISLRSPAAFWTERAARHSRATGLNVSARRLREMIFSKVWQQLGSAFEIDPAVDFVAVDSVGPERGIQISIELKTADPTPSLFRLWLPARFFRRLQGVARPGLPMPKSGLRPKAIHWNVLVAGATQRLRLTDLGRLGPEAVVRLNTNSACLVTRGGGGGWLLEPRTDVSGPKPEFVVGARWSQLLESGGPMSLPGDRPDMKQIFVTLQVILGEREISAEDLERYRQGAVIELQRGAEEPVDLAINGRVLGRGRLVRLADSSLGVQILGWDAE